MTHGGQNKYRKNREDFKKKNHSHLTTKVVNNYANIYRFVLIALSRKSDSNQQPSDYKSDALPLKLFRLICARPTDSAAPVTLRNKALL